MREGRTMKLTYIMRDQNAPRAGNNYYCCAARSLLSSPWLINGPAAFQ